MAQKPIIISGGSKLGLDVLKEQNPQHADKLDELAKSLPGRQQIIATILDNIKGRIHSVTNIQWSVLGFSGPGWIVMCIGGIDIRCPQNAKDFIVELFKAYYKYAPELATALLEEVTNAIGVKSQNSGTDGST